MITVGHRTGISYRDSHPWLWMTMVRAISEKFDRTTWRSKWIPHLEKFSKKSWWAFPSWNQTWVGVGSEEDVPERRGFRDGVDLHLGAIHSLSEREKGRETNKHNITTQNKIDRKERVRMHEKCMNMWRAKRNCIMGSTQSKPSSTQFSTFNKCMKHCENANGM